jgi:hypothetical protein
LCISHDIGRKKQQEDNAFDPLHTFGLSGTITWFMGSFFSIFVDGINDFSIGVIPNKVLSLLVDPFFPADFGPRLFIYCLDNDYFPISSVFNHLKGVTSC